MAKAYRIKNWSTHFEKAQSRAHKSMSWVALPNKHDGKGFRRLMRHRNGTALYGAWVLIIQVASKCPVRGTLIDLDGPLSTLDISDKTGAPLNVVEDAIKALLSQEIGWIEEFDAISTLSARYQHADSTSIPAMPVVDASVLTEQNRTEQLLVSSLDRLLKSNGHKPKDDWELDIPFLSNVMTADLSDLCVLCFVHRKCNSIFPEHFPATEDCLIRVIAFSAHSAKEAKTNRAGLFRYLVCNPSKAKIDADAKASAREMLSVHRERLKATESPNPAIIPLCDERKDSA